MVTRMSAKIHKWLALVLVIPILFWFISGLFFAIAPIETVRSEHMMAEAAPVPIPMGAAAAGLAKVAASGAVPGEKIELRGMMGRTVALVSNNEARPRLYDLESGRKLSPRWPLRLPRVIMPAMRSPCGSSRLPETRPNIAAHCLRGGSISTTGLTARCTSQRIPVLSPRVVQPFGGCLTFFGRCTSSISRSMRISTRRC